MKRLNLEEILYALYHFPLALSSPFISWYFFKISGSDFLGSGLIIAIPYLGLIFSTAFFGRLSDKIGSRNIVLISLAAYFISFIVYYLVGNNEYAFFISYITFNLISSGFIPAFNRLVSFYEEKERSEGYGRLGATASIGFLLGSLIASLLIDQSGIQILFLFGALFAFLTFLSAFKLKKIETNNRKINEDSYFDTYNILQNSFSFKNIYILLFLVMLTQITNSVFVGFFAIYLEFELLISVSWVSTANAIATLLGVGGTYFVGKIADRIKRKPLIILSLILYTLLPLTIFMIPNPFIAVIMYCIPIYSVYFVLVPILISENTPKEQRGQKMGLYGAFQYVGIFTGTLLGAVIASFTGIIKMNFLVAAVIGVVTIIIGILFFKESPKNIRESKNTEV